MRGLVCHCVLVGTFIPPEGVFCVRLLRISEVLAAATCPHARQRPPCLKLCQNHPLRGIKFPTVSAMACDANVHGGARRQADNELTKMQPIRIIQLESPIRLCPDSFDPILHKQYYFDTGYPERLDRSAQNKISLGF